MTPSMSFHFYQEDKTDSYIRADDQACLGPYCFTYKMEDWPRIKTHWAKRQCLEGAGNKDTWLEWGWFEVNEVEF